MRKILSASVVGIVFAGALASSAAATKTEGSVPPWLLAAIRKSGVSDPQNAKISTYQFKGKVVYLVPAERCCDFMSTVYSSSGEILCHPDGGITGKGDFNCPRFKSQAKFLKRVWPVSKAGNSSHDAKAEH